MEEGLHALDFEGLGGGVPGAEADVHLFAALGDDEAHGGGVVVGGGGRDVDLERGDLAPQAVTEQGRLVMLVERRREIPNEVFRQDIKADVRIYYGTDDQIIRQRLGRLGADYQLVLKGAPLAQAKTNLVLIPVQGGTHRLTFLSGSVDAKAWMDSLR